MWYFDYCVSSRTILSASHPKENEQNEKGWNECEGWGMSWRTLMCFSWTWYVCSTNFQKLWLPAQDQSSKNSQWYGYPTFIKVDMIKYPDSSFHLKKNSKKKKRQFILLYTLIQGLQITNQSISTTQNRNEAYMLICLIVLKLTSSLLNYLETPA